jgi:hypothetical protein
MTENEEQTAFYRALGFAIAQWSHVEDSLHVLYLRALGLYSQEAVHALSATAAFYAAIAAETKLAMTNSAVMFELNRRQLTEKSTAYIEWDALRKKAARRQRTRNMLAHFQVLVTMHSKEGRRWELRPRLFDANNLLRYQGRSFPRFFVSDLECVARSFGALSQKLKIFGETLE